MADQNIDPDHVCPICLGLLNIPVWIPNKTCECSKTRHYCLTCFRDLVSSSSDDRFGRTKSSVCPMCRGINTNSQYEADQPFLEHLDRQYGPQKCPRGCPYIDPQAQMRQHLGQCPQSKRFTCFLCRKTCDLSTIIACLDHHFRPINCYVKLLLELMFTCYRPGFYCLTRR